MQASEWITQEIHCEAGKTCQRSRCRIRWRNARGRNQCRLKYKKFPDSGRN
jgi:hypothetical protein